MTQISIALMNTYVALRREGGAVGMLILGIAIGVLLVIFGIVKFLIPGE